MIILMMITDDDDTDDTGDTEIQIILMMMILQILPLPLPLFIINYWESSLWRSAMGILGGGGATHHLGNAFTYFQYLNSVLWIADYFEKNRKLISSARIPR